MSRLLSMQFSMNSDGMVNRKRWGRSEENVKVEMGSPAGAAQLGRPPPEMMQVLPFITVLCL